MPRKLDIFDFDGTLFNSPSDTPENHKLYEQHTGIPWLIDKEMSNRLTKKLGRFVGMRRGWWGKAETLQPPLVPDPAPKELWNAAVVEAFEKSKADPDALTVILTGRHAGLKNAVLRIIKQGKVMKIVTKHAKGGADYYEVADENASIYFLGENGPVPNKKDKPGDTLSWKLWVINQFFEVHADLEAIEFWEDREEHIPHFQEVDKTLGLEGLKVVVNHITSGP